MSKVKRSIVIHAPLQRVLGLARDPKRWGEWYCGVSGEQALACGPGTREVAVGMRFPLIQQVMEDRGGPGGALWRTRSKDRTETAVVDAGRTVVLLAGEQVWDYRPKNGDTEVAVEVDFEVPAELLARGTGPAEVDRMEAETLEHSLANLRALCEAS